MNWVRSSFSSSNGTCWEVATEGGKVFVRNSNRPDDGILILSGTTWDELLTAAKVGGLDHLL